MVASECEPWAKTGGLADVVDALSRALGSPPRPGSATRSTSTCPGTAASRRRPACGRSSCACRSAARRRDGPRFEAVTLWSGEADGYRLRLVEHAASFDRAGLYMDGGGDYPDNAARFTLLGRAALEAIRAEARPVDVIHGHDWQAGPALLSLRHRYAVDPLLARSATMLTCHNLAYHGWTPRDRAWQLDLPDSVGEPEGVDLLREAIYAADIVNTVSPTYARESLTPEYGGGLDEVLRDRGDRYLGIINGIDTELWDPATDPALAAHLRRRRPGRQGPGQGRPRRPPRPRCRRPDPRGRRPARPAEGLRPGGRGGAGAARPGRPPHRARAPATAQLVAGLVRAGAGATRPRRRPRPLRRDEARRIYAGADLFLMPSRFEPCGQGQLIAMRYGTPPVVRRIGGLADTVIDADADPRAGTGFVFGPAEPGALVEAVRRAIAALADERALPPHPGAGHGPRPLLDGAGAAVRTRLPARPRRLAHAGQSRASAVSRGEDGVDGDVAAGALDLRGRAGRRPTGG